LRRRSD